MMHADKEAGDMRANAWMEPVKESVRVKAGGCMRDTDFDIDGTENPSLISRGGIPAAMADGTKPRCPFSSLEG